MSSRPSLAGIETLLIDGNNLLHRTSGSVDAGAQRLLLARLRNALPDTLRTILMLDGHAASGTDRRQRVTRQLEIHHAGSLSADDALVNVVRDKAPGTRHSMTIVTDDRSLTERVRHLGARTQRLAWLEELLTPGAVKGAPKAGVGIGTPNRSSKETEPAEEREPWTPGRGATKKRGNPRRLPR
ncbi:MAG TPA: hypothetical protein VEX62_07520 [Candidatus Limnocylindrales bacterium]|nr:hypothetical protein [Candidatus Limnocylindrales bacterium]